MHPSVILGSSAKSSASSQKGWVVGHFMSEGVAQTADFEIKIWHYSEPPDYGQKLFTGSEFIIVERGYLRLELEVPDGHGSYCSEQVELSGEFRGWVILPPNCKKRVMVTQVPSFGITVRWPSAPGTNVAVE